MTIKFICTCGKHLRARDEMAMRRSVCPRCGNPVGIPSLGPTHRGAPLGPMTRDELLRRRSKVSTDTPAGDATVKDNKHQADRLGKEDPLRRLLREHIASLVNPHARRPRQLEKHWYECLFYPVRVGVLVIGLAAALTALCGGILLALPQVVEMQLDLWAAVLFATLGLVIASIIVGFACLLLDGALKTAPVGDLHAHWLWHSIGLALRSCLTWLVCFLAGPVLPIGGSVLYWYYCGDPKPVDWLILADLNILGMGYGLFALLAVSQNDRLVDANPIYIADLAYHLGFRSVVVALLTAALVLGHGLLALVALQELRRDAGLGWILLFCCWLNGMFWVAFLLRLLGVWCQQMPRIENRE
jgi:hypothetical protein